jgi:hypothetical protein
VNELLAWRQSQDSLEVLQKVAPAVVRVVEAKGLPYDVWPHPPLGSLDRDGRRELVEDVAQDLWVFLSDAVVKNPRRYTQLLHAVAQGNISGFKAFLATGYSWHLLDQNSTKGKNPYRYFQKRFGDVLRKDPNVRYAPEMPLVHKTAYSFGPRATGDAVVGSPELRSGLSYARWVPSPRTMVTETEFWDGEKETLLALAQFFWQLACDKLGRGVFVPVGELMKYLSRHYDFLKKIYCESTGGSEGELPDEACELEAGIPAGLVEVAQGVTNAWTLRRRKVFYQMHCNPEASPAQLADLVDLGSSTAVRYHISEIISDVSSACADLGIDGDGVAFSVLQEKLAEICEAAV